MTELITTPDRYQTLYEACQAQRHEEEELYAALREKYQVMSIEYEILLGERNEARRQLSLVREHYRGLLGRERRAAQRQIQQATKRAFQAKRDLKKWAAETIAKSLSHHEAINAANARAEAAEAERDKACMSLTSTIVSEARAQLVAAQLREDIAKEQSYSDEMKEWRDEANARAEAAEAERDEARTELADLRERAKRATSAGIWVDEPEMRQLRTERDQLLTELNGLQARAEAAEAKLAVPTASDTRHAGRWFGGVDKCLSEYSALGAGIELLARMKKLEEALAWYSEPDNYEPQGIPDNFGIPIADDKGERARQALEGKNDG